MDVSDGDWEETDLIEISEIGNFELNLKKLENNTEFEFRAVVVHPKIHIYGDIKRVKTN